MASPEAASSGNPRPTALDLFCGAGGFSLGLTEAGFEFIGAADNWSVATRSYEANFKHSVITCDLIGKSGRELLADLGASGSQVDLVVGGPPCQGFSIQRVGADVDCRNNLILEFARLVSELRPRLFLMENVPGLLGKRGKNLLAEFHSRMHDSGYHTTQIALNAADFGVPQVRKRVLIAGWKFGQPEFALSFQPCVTQRTVLEAFAGLPEPPEDLTPHPSDSLHRRTRLSPLNQKRIALIPPGGGMQNLPKELRVNCHQAGADKIGHRYVYGRLSPDKPAATITARFDSFTRGKFGHPVAPRNITLREGARLQSFPDHFAFIGSQEEVAAQIGNAIPPRVSAKLGMVALDYIRMLKEMGF